jgi:hypothetical protein
MLVNIVIYVTELCLEMTLCNPNAYIGNAFELLMSEGHDAFAPAACNPFAEEMCDWYCPDMRPH